MANAKFCYEFSLVVNFANKYDYKIFSYIKSLTHHYSIPPSVCFNSVTATSDYDKAILFNQFFNSTFSASPLFTGSDQVLSPLSLQRVISNCLNQLFTER